MSENKLKLNPDKTEFIVFGAKDRHKWPQGPSSYQEVSFCGYISGDCKCSGQ